MVTVGKKEKPKIYTESDKILKDLNEELAGLKSRMQAIEVEQKHNRDLLDQLSFNEDLTNEIITNQQEENKTNKENYKIIANVMHDLKSPVSDVVDNLAGIISEIEDKEAQDTLRDCMNTASNVLDSFTEVEDFCLDVGSDHLDNQTTVNVRAFFRGYVSILQQNLDFNDRHTVRLLVDKNVPTNSPMYEETIKVCLKNLLMELRNTITASVITVMVGRESNEKKYGIEISDLTIELKADHLTDLEWGDSFVESIRNNQDKLLNQGFNILKIRDLLKKSGGQLKIQKKDNTIQGFKFHLPLTY